MNEIANFDNDFKLSAKFKKEFNKFYLSEHFKENYIKPMYKVNRGVFVKEISRSDDLKLQIGVQCDAVLKLSNGNRLLMDDKVQRGRYIDFGFPIEVVSNTAKKTDGWGYKKGVRICFAQLNEDNEGFLERPFCFSITDSFIDEVVRSNNFITKLARNKGYYTVFKKVPKDVLMKYWEGKKVTACEPQGD